MIPWSDWLYAAMRLGVTPADFWRLSVAEWLAITGMKQRGDFARADLTRLMAQFPD